MQKKDKKSKLSDRKQPKKRNWPMKKIRKNLLLSLPSKHQKLKNKPNKQRESLRNQKAKQALRVRKPQPKSQKKQSK